MSRIVLALLSGLVLLGATECKREPKIPTDGSAPAATGELNSGTAKPMAPVAISAALEPQRARITVRFHAPASEVNVNVSGVDGLEVTSDPNLIEAGTFAANDERAFDVEFRNPEDARSHLVVAVTGEFRGSKSARVSSFAIGAPTRARRHTAEVETPDGQRLKVMPSQ